jgi:protein SCO1/2
MSRLRQLSLSLFLLSVSSAQIPNQLPRALRDVGIDQRLGQQIPLDVPFRDETGATVQIGQYFGRKPVILAPVYYECPMLCTMVLNGLVRGLRPLSFAAGREFDVVAVSFNPAEQPGLAAKKKLTYVQRYGKHSDPAGWHFLTGDEASIRKLMQSIGFRYAWDEDTKQYVHASAVMLLTPDGRLSRYLYGVDYEPKDLRLGIIESSNEKIASAVDQVLLYCFHYDPITGRYGLVIMNVLRAFALLTLGVLLTFVIVMVRRENHSTAVS